MTEEEKISMKKWSKKKQRQWRDWIYQKSLRQIERYCFVNHQQPCECHHCKVYRQRIRIKCQRPVKRKAR